MSGAFLQKMLRANRLGQALVMASWLAAGAAYLRVTDPGPVVLSDVVEGRVREIHANVYVVVLADGREVRLWGSSPRAVGARVDIVAERYADGSDSYRFETSDPPL
jgi:hypothetical protein